MISGVDREWTLVQFFFAQLASKTLLQNLGQQDS